LVQGDWLSNLQVSAYQVGISVLPIPPNRPDIRFR
jgi:hypothetical protein